MAFVKRGKIECTLFGCTLTYINHTTKTHPTNGKRVYGNYTMIKKAVTLPIVDEQHDLAMSLNGQWTDFDFVNNKAIIKPRIKSNE